MRTIILVLIGAVCSLALSGAVCRSHATEEAAETTSASADTEDPILAKVDGHPIRQSDVDLLYAQLGLRPGDVSQEKAIEELIRRESIRHFILASDVEVDASVLEARWERFKEHVVASGRSIEQVLEQYRLSEERFKEVLMVQLGLDQLAEARITEAELDSLEELVRASHILVQVREGGSQTEWQQAEKMILFIKQEIEKGQPFEKCAEAYSDCNSKTRGGDLSFFPRKGVMDETFAAAAYALEVGELSEPVKTRFGYHLIKVTERSKELAKQRLIATKRAEIVEEIRKKVKVERFYKSESETEEEPSGGDDGSSSGEAQ